MVSVAVMITSEIRNLARSPILCYLYVPVNLMRAILCGKMADSRRNSMRARRTLPWALLLSIAWLCPIARAQEPQAASAAPATAADLSQLRSDLADTRSELESCKQEIVQLRAQIQQVLAATGAGVRPGAGSEQDVYPTVTS